MNNDNRNLDVNRDPARHSVYWSENFSGRDYVEQGSSFDAYGLG